MDNVFEIIIWLFVIISFLSSLFKKKKQEPPKPTIKKPSPYYGEGTNSYRQPQKTVKQDDYDILKELEGLFNPEAKTTQGYPQQDELEKNKTYSEHTSTESERASSEYTSYETGRSSSEYTSVESQRKVTELEKRKSEHERTSSEHVFSDYIKRKPEISKEMEAKAKSFEQLLDERRRQKNTAAVRGIKEKLKSSSIRDVIIMSEIIGKPKSLS